MKFRYYVMLALFALAINSNANAQIIFDLNDNANFEGGVGTTVTATDDIDTVQLVVEELFALEIDPDPNEDGDDADAALTGNPTNEVVLFTGPGGLGLQNETARNGPALIATGATPESSTINGGEGITFSLDTDVTFADIEFSGLDAGEEAFVTIDGNPTVFSFDSNDPILDPFGGFEIAAGTGITVAGAADGFSDTFRLQNFSVNVASVPEPSSIALLGLGSLLMVTRRRR